MRKAVQSEQPPTPQASSEMRAFVRSHRGWKRALCCVACLIAILAAVHGGACPPDECVGEGKAQGQGSLEAVFPGLELVRCLFREGRLVARYQGELTVLHSGDRLEDADLEVAEANGDRIVLQRIETRTSASGIALPKALVVLSRIPDGRVSIRAYSSESPDGAGSFLFPQGATASATALGKGLSTESEIPESSPGAATEDNEAED